MKLIDEKGRLFGKLNIIDALVLVIMVLAVALVGYKVWTNHQVQSQQALENGSQEENWLIYTVKIEEVDAVTYEAVKRYVDKNSGLIDQMFTGVTMQDGYVVDVTGNPHVTYVECEDGTVKRVESSGEDDRVDMVFTCVANVKDTQNNNLGGQEIRTGIPYIMKTPHFEFRTGEVTSVIWLENREELAQYIDLDALNTIRGAFLLTKTGN